MKSIIVKVTFNERKFTISATGLVGILRTYLDKGITVTQVKPRKVGVCRCRVLHYAMEKYCFSCGKRIGGAK